MTDESPTASPEEASESKPNHEGVDSAVKTVVESSAAISSVTDSTPVADSGGPSPGEAVSSPPDSLIDESVADARGGTPTASDVAANGGTTTPAALSNQPGVIESSPEGTAPRRKIQVGSRLGAIGPGQSSKPQLAGAANDPEAPALDAAATPILEPPAFDKAKDDQSGQSATASSDLATAAKVPAPTRRSPLSPDVQQAVEDAIADVSLDDLMTNEAADRATQEIELDSRCRGRVVRKYGENIFFAVGGRHEGVASVRLFKEPPEVGDELDVVVKSFQAEEGLYELAIPGAAISVADWSDLDEGAVVEARITGANTGGLECMVGQIRGFIPSSQIGLFRVEDFAEYIGKKLDCVVTEVNPKRRNLVVSHRAMLEREKEEARRVLLEQLEPGQTLEGTVRSLRDFGAFVDIGGVDGLVHISQLSWDRVEHPRDVLEEGQKVRVKVEKINRETGKIGLSYRDLLEDPWKTVESEMAVGSTVRGPVTRIAKFGAFVKLAPGVEGLVHISELSHQRVRQVSEVVREGEEVDVKILSIDREAQRIALSLKATLAAPEQEAAVEDDASDQAESALPTRKRKKPLKGGFDRPSGGEAFGLKW